MKIYRIEKNFNSVYFFAFFLKTFVNFIRLSIMKRKKWEVMRLGGQYQTYGTA